MIAVVYIGQNRFRKTTVDNHKLFLNRLKTFIDYKIYDFSGHPRNNCPYNPEILEQRGNLQVWDLASCLDKITEDVILKIRTDLWFTNSSIDTIINETQKVLSNEHDVSFLGHNFKRTFAEKYLVEKDITKEDNVRDLVVILRKSKIHSSEQILENVRNFGHVRSGNKIHGQILKQETKAVNIYCQLYLVRESLPRNIDPWTVCFKFVDSWNPKKAKEAMDWILTMRGRYKDI